MGNMKVVVDVTASLSDAPSPTKAHGVHMVFRPEEDRMMSRITEVRRHDFETEVAHLVG